MQVAARSYVERIAQRAEVAPSGLVLMGQPYGSNVA
jgi:hypothetical protein